MPDTSSLRALLADLENAVRAGHPEDIFAARVALDAAMFDALPGLLDEIEAQRQKVRDISNLVAELTRLREENDRLAGLLGEARERGEHDRICSVVRTESSFCECGWDDLATRIDAALTTRKDRTDGR